MGLRQKTGFCEIGVGAHLRVRPIYGQTHRSAPTRINPKPHFLTQAPGKSIDKAPAFSYYLISKTLFDTDPGGGDEL